MTKYNEERALITHVVAARDIKTAIREKITTGFFGDPTNRDAWDWLLERYESHGKVPSLKLLQSHFPDFEEEEVEDEAELIIASLKEKKLYADLQAASKKIATEARNDSFEALKTFLVSASDLSVKFSHSGTIDLTQSADAIRKQYRILKRRKGMLGIPWPWEALNVSTRGARKSAFYAFYGDPGTMKTWLLIYTLHFMHREHDARPILFVGEMPPEDVMIRWAALRAGVPYGDLLSGSLTPKQERRLERALNQVHEDDAFIIEEMDSSGKEALQEIQAKSSEHGANVIGVDGLGDLSANSEWGSWWEVCKGLKAITRRLRVPLIGSHHTNRARTKATKAFDPEKEKDAGDVALGEALFRYTDGLFRIFRTPIHIENEEIGWMSKKVREGMPCHFTVNAKVGVDFSQKRNDLEEDMGGLQDDEDTL